MLHHGRGTDERDLLGLADVLDPRATAARGLAAGAAAAARLAGLPLVPGPARRLPRPRHLPGRPRGARRAARRALGGDRDRARPHRPRRLLDGRGDELRDGALGAERPPVAGILAFSGFVPIVEDWQPSLEDRRDTAAFIAHGRNDPIMEIGFARRARELLEAGGLEVAYRESDVGHQIDPARPRRRDRVAVSGSSPSCRRSSRTGTRRPGCGSCAGSSGAGCRSCCSSAAPRERSSRP